MGDPARRGAVDYETLSRTLRGLAWANRLELLSQLRVPRAVADLHLQAARRDRLRDPDRPLSRNAVEKHLEALRELDLVQSRAARREGQPVTEYFVNPPRLFLLLDQLRRLTLLTSSAAAHTVPGNTPRSAEDEAPVLPAGPSLLLVNGPLEGTAFPLAGAGPWRIGRQRGLDIALTYDPFVSLENTEVRRHGEGFAVRALPGARNGTQVNWTPLEPDRLIPLDSADLLGVGRSLLLFRAFGPRSGRA